MRYLAMTILAFSLVFSAFGAMPSMAAQEETRPDVINILTARLATAATAEEADEIAAALEAVYSESTSASAEALLSQTRLVVADGDATVALYKLERALLLDEGLLEAYVLRGNVYLSMGEIEGAFSDAMEAVQRAPDYHAALGLLARAFELRGQTASALATSRQALVYNPLSEELQAQLERHEAQAAGAGL